MQKGDIDFRKIGSFPDGRTAAVFKQDKISSVVICFERSFATATSRSRNSRTTHSSLFPTARRIPSLRTELTYARSRVPVKCSSRLPRVVCCFSHSSVALANCMIDPSHGKSHSDARTYMELVVFQYMVIVFAQLLTVDSRTVCRHTRNTRVTKDVETMVTMWTTISTVTTGTRTRRPTPTRTAPALLHPPTSLQSSTTSYYFFHHSRTSTTSTLHTLTVRSASRGPCLVSSLSADLPSLTPSSRILAISERRCFRRYARRRDPSRFREENRHALHRRETSVIDSIYLRRVDLAYFVVATIKFHSPLSAGRSRWCPRWRRSHGSSPCLSRLRHDSPSCSLVPVFPQFSRKQ